MMLGAKLRSEKLDQYDALGERGQPLYQAASQILTALGRQKPELAAHFAVPQLSSDGAVIDWYAPSEGAVVPWNAATESERVAASAALEDLRQKLATFRESRLQDDNGGSSLFVQMLRWVPEYPDSSHVYIVNGKPVLTFWGFQSRGGADHLPLHAVAPDTSGEKIRVPVSPAVSVDTPPETVRPLNPAPLAPVPVVAQPWWKRWWLWLLLLPLLLLLLFGLRGCMPSGGAMPGFSWPWSARPAADLSVPNIAVPNVALPNLPRLPGGAAGTGLPAVALDGNGGVAPAGGSADLPAAGLAPEPAAAPADPLPGLDPQAPAALPEVATALPAADGPADPAAAMAPQLPGTQPAGDPLIIPPGQADGAADFLNGDWGVRAGIQDRNTGQPLRLHYSFQDGQGQVTLARHNGVVCQAPVRAAMSAGALAITNQSDAVCSDGQTFAMPAIQCRPGQTQAACQGQYGDDYFPLTMRQTQP